MPASLLRYIATIAALFLTPSLTTAQIRYEDIPTPPSCPVDSQGRCMTDSPANSQSGSPSNYPDSPSADPGGHAPDAHSLRTHLEVYRHLRERLSRYFSYLEPTLEPDTVNRLGGSLTYFGTEARNAFIRDVMHDHSTQRNRRDRYVAVIESFPDLDTMRSEISKLAAQSKTEKQLAIKAEREVAALERQYERWRRLYGSRLPGDDAQSKIQQWFYVFSPPENRDLWKSANERKNRYMHAVGKAAANFYPRESSYTQPLLLAPKQRISERDVPIVEGTITEKLVALEKLAHLYERAVEERSTWRREADSLEPAAEERLRAHKERWTYTDVIANSRHKRQHDEREVQSYLYATRSLHDGIIARVAQDFLWRTFDKHVIEPQLRRFAVLNAGADAAMAIRNISDREIKELFEQGSGYLPTVTRYTRGMQEFLAVQKRTLDMWTNFEQFLAEAPRVAALATPQESESFVEQLQAAATREGIGLMRHRSLRYATITTTYPPSQLRRELRAVAYKLRLLRPDED